MAIRTPLLALLLLLTAGAAAAQSLPGPVVAGRRPQPTQQEIDRRERGVGLYPAREGDRRAPSETDRLYDEIMRAAAPALGY